MSLADFPYHYHAYGLNVQSEIPVTGFLTAQIEQADVTIVIGEVPDHLQAIINKGVLFESNQNEFLLNIDSIARFHVLHGNELRVAPYPMVNSGDISSFISGTVFGALLHQRHMLPIHASTVVWKGKCMIFSGISGSGKSTLASSMIRDGGMLVADDISVISFKNQRPEVMPAFPMMRIWADSLKHLGISSEDLQPVRTELKKFYWPVSNFSNMPVAIDHFFVLGSHNREEIESREITGLDKFRILKKHTYLFRGIRDTGQQKHHFELVSKLAAAVRVTTLNRPNGSFNTPELLHYLEKNG